MIGRIWHGWTKAANAEPYEQLLANDVLPGIHRVPGYHGACLLRRAVPEGVEFVTITFFESMQAVRAFAGEDVEKAVVHEPARRLLDRFDERSVHYDVALGPEVRR